MKFCKKLICIPITCILLTLLGSFFVAFASDKFGVCGDEVTWELNEESGELHFHGSGQMVNEGAHECGVSPWHECYGASHLGNGDTTIKTVYFDEGITNIAEWSFGLFRGIKTFYIPKSITTIENGAFSFFPDSEDPILDIYYSGSKEDWEKIIIKEGNELLTTGKSEFEIYTNVIYHFNYVRPVASLKIKQMPKKTKYTVGEKADLSDLVLTVFFDDGSKQNITDDFTVESFDTSSPGEKFVSVSYGNQSVGFSIEVEEPEPQNDMESSNVLPSVSKDAIPSKDLPSPINYKLIFMIISGGLSVVLIVLLVLAVRAGKKQKKSTEIENIKNE